MRNRSSAIAITQNTKKRLSEEIGLNENMREDVRKEKITNYLADKIRNNTTTLKINKTKEDYQISDIPPPYLDIKKDYHTKNEKVYTK
jgi:hypothetical protein